MRNELMVHQVLDFHHISFVFHLLTVFSFVKNKLILFRLTGERLPAGIFLRIYKLVYVHISSFSFVENDVRRQKNDDNE